MTSEPLAAQERAAFEPLRRAVSAILAEPVVRPGGEQSSSPSAFSPLERAELMRRIVSTEEKTISLIKAYASAAARSEDAARKAAAWGITGTLMTSIVLVIVAIVVTVFTYGSSLGASVAALEAQVVFLGVAARAGHPLAGELAAILKQLATALTEFSRQRERDHRAAVARVLAEVDRAVTSLEGLPARAASIPGRCEGDPRAVFEACSSLDAAIGGFDAVLRQVPPRDVDTTALILAVATVRRTLADSIPTLALKM